MKQKFEFSPPLCSEQEQEKVDANPLVAGGGGGCFLLESVRASSEVSCEEGGNSFVSFSVARFPLVLIHHHDYFSHSLLFTSQSTASDCCSSSSSIRVLSADAWNYYFGAKAAVEKQLPNP